MRSVHVSRHFLDDKELGCGRTSGRKTTRHGVGPGHRGVRTLVVLKAAPVASYFVSRCEGAGEGTGNDHLPDRPDPPTSKRRPRGMPSAG